MISACVFVLWMFDCVFLFLYVMDVCACYGCLCVYVCLWLLCVMITACVFVLWMFVRVMDV